MMRPIDIIRSRRRRLLLEASEAAAGGDPYFAMVASLIHFDGADGGTTFTDQKGVEWTRANNAVLDDERAQFGATSLKCVAAGVTDSLSAEEAGLVIGTEDFTLECWWNPDQLGGTDPVILFGGGWNIQSYGAGTGMAVWDGDSHPIFEAIGSMADAWHHIALTRQGTTMRLWVDGEQVGNDATDSTDFTDDAIQLNSATSAWFDDFRLTIGVARYTEAFDVPTEAFPDD